MSLLSSLYLFKFFEKINFNYDTVSPYSVLFGLLVITFMATSIIPTAALLVLMVPIALKTQPVLEYLPMF